VPHATATKRRPPLTKSAADRAFYVLERDGVTFSTLSTFRDCRWKARHYLRGLTRNSIGLPIIFGNVVHAALERCYRAQRDAVLKGEVPPAFLMRVLTEIEATVKVENPRMTAETSSDLERVMLLSEQVLPRYFRHWAARDREFAWEQTEKEFRIPYAVDLPPQSVKGVWQPRTVHTFLRGKIDGVFSRAKGMGVLETKTKGRVEPGNIMSMLPYMLQPSVYLIAAEEEYRRPAVSVVYNIVRRPGLYQRKTETIPQFAVRVGEDIDERPDWYFMRINMDLEPNDVARMRADLADLLRDYVLWWIGEGAHYPNDSQCENKYGTCEFLEWCSGGNRLLYYQRPKLFSELGEA
jgi:hypothetical protein